MQIRARNLSKFRCGENSGQAKLSIGANSEIGANSGEDIYHNCPQNQPHNHISVSHSSLDSLSFVIHRLHGYPALLCLPHPDLCFLRFPEMNCAFSIVSHCHKVSTKEACSITVEDKS